MALSAVTFTSELLFVWSLLGIFGLCYGDLSDINCLKSIKDSLEDPFSRLGSWDFTNNTYGFICKFVGITCWHDNDDMVLMIELPNMGLKGKFPRGIKACKSLVQLDLSHNQLSGPIPRDIAHLLPYLTGLDLSNNSFYGEIPVSLASCNYLNSLGLDRNRLTGSIPSELGMLQRLKRFSITHNLLSGQVPEFSKVNVTRENYANNKQLCGGPLKPCHKKNSDDWFKFFFEIGFSLSFVAVFSFFCIPWVEMKKRMKMLALSMLEKKNKSKEADEVIKFRMLRQKEVRKFERTVNKMNFTELSKATENFSDDNVIGLGMMGTTYKATLPNGWFLAIKRLHDDSEKSENKFISELVALSRLRHENIIPLLGFCIENNEKLLVYKYMSNGNLYDWLHPMEGDVDAKILVWPLRVKIAVGIARGLAWLHHKTKLRVVHRNISSHCILLDRYFEPMISNFGDAIVSNNGGVMFVYPNETDSGLLVNSMVWDSDFVKKDVYNFGIVLLELITGKEPMSTSSSSSLHKSLVEWIGHLSTNSSLSLTGAIDKYLIGQGFDEEIIVLLKIACECVHPYPNHRATMLQVYNTLSTTMGQKYGLVYDF